MDWSEGDVALLTEQVAWAASERSATRGCFLVRDLGTNAHVILEEPPRWIESSRWW